MFSGERTAPEAAPEAADAHNSFNGPWSGAPVCPGTVLGAGAWACCCHCDMLEA